MPISPPSASAADTGRMPIGDPGRRQPNSTAPATTAPTNSDITRQAQVDAEARRAETRPMRPTAPIRPIVPAEPTRPMWSAEPTETPPPASPTARREPAPTAPARRALVAAPTPRRETAAPAAAPPAAPAAVRPEVRRPEGIVSYWLRLRGSRRLPSTADLDFARIATEWPNSILMRCRTGSKVLEPEKVFSGNSKLAVGAPGVATVTTVDMSPMMLQWLLTLAGDAARERRPMQDTEAFPSRNESVHYGAFALPFSDDQTRIDHVLCHVYQAG